MILSWFSPREAAEVGASLAEQFAHQTASASPTGGKRATLSDQSAALQGILKRADQEVRTLRLNFYKTAKFANSFKWRLLEFGVERELADEVTQRLVIHLSGNQTSLAMGRNPGATPTDGPYSNDAKYLLAQGNKCIARGDYSEAIAFYRNLIRLNPRHAVALNNLGSALCKLGHYKEAEDHFRQAIRIKPDYPEAHGNFGTVLRWSGRIAEAEISLRHALKLRPNYIDARNSLGLTLILLGRLRDAKARFEKVLKVSRSNTDALLGLGQVAKLEGRFDEAEVMFKRVLEINPKMPGAWAALVGIRTMTPSDGAWLKGAEEIAASGGVADPLEVADVHFAIGKYCDDVQDFERAFKNYKRANELQKAVSENYERDVHTRFVDDLIRAYTKETVADLEGASDSMKPIFVVGMMRSGTSLAEQIIASHPSVTGAGELPFWSAAVHEHETAVREGTLGHPIRKKLAEAYLDVLRGHSVDAPRIVDKTPINSDYLGMIHSVFPNARILYMRRDPIDTCLSCFFQALSPALNFAMDMSDLAHYYREHHRLMAHWRAVLPGTILDVPYAGLVADQVGWTRKILEFLGLDWDESCLDFHKTTRPVVTASYWQVRQKIHKNSVGRWRNYERWIGPLLDLKDLDL
jgi:tetratricopeptide (TPR) repeat protein